MYIYIHIHILVSLYPYAISTLIFISLRLCSELQIKKHFMLHQYIPAYRWSYSVRCRLQLVDLCKGRFESRRWHGYWSVVFVVCCVSSGLCDDVITGIEECVCVCVCLILCCLESSNGVSVTVAVSVTQNSCFSLHSASPPTCSSIHPPSQ